MCCRSVAPFVFQLVYDTLRKVWRITILRKKILLFLIKYIGKFSAKVCAHLVLKFATELLHDRAHLSLFTVMESKFIHV